MAIVRYFPPTPEGVDPVEWRDTVLAHCRIIGPDDYVCSLDNGHPGNHEAWTNEGGDLLRVWSTPDPALHVPVSHDGAATSIPVSRVGTEGQPLGTAAALGVPSATTQRRNDCPAVHPVEPGDSTRMFACTLDKGHEGVHVAHGMIDEVWAMWKDEGDG